MHVPAHITCRKPCLPAPKPAPPKLYPPPSLRYNVTISEPGRYTPRFPLVNQRLYDNEVEGQFYLLYDAHKRLLSCEDCYPKAVRLGKGEHVVKVQMRHDSVGLLEKLKAMPLLLDRALEDKVRIRSMR